MVSKMKIPITIQMHPGENGIAAISSMLGVYGKYVPLSMLCEKVKTSRNGLSPEQLSEAARPFGLESTELRVAKEDVSVPLRFFLDKYAGVMLKMQPGEGFEKGGKKERLLSMIGRRR